MAGSDLPRPPRSWASSSRDPTVFYRQNRSLDGTHSSLPSPHIRSRPRRRRTVRVARLRSEYIRNSQPAHPRVPRRSRHRYRASSSQRSESSSRPRSRHPADDRDPSARRRYRPRDESPATYRRRPSLVDAARNLATNWIEEKSRLDDAQMTRPVSMVAMRPPFPLGGSEGDKTRRVYGRAPKPTVPTTQVTPLQNTVASSGGITCSILLAEPNVYLNGFDHDSRARRNNGPSGTALLRGKLQLVVSKNVKIKALQLKLVGRTRTDWPEGIPPMRMQEWEEDSLRTQVLTFYNATYGSFETEYGNQCSFSLAEDNDPPHSEVSFRAFTNGFDSPPPSSDSIRRSKTTSKELKRLGLRSVRARSFGQGEDSSENTTPNKGYKIFRPGTYEYSFELPIDHHQVETTRLPFGSVKWELQATVERAGAFRPNLHGSRELSIVRLPDQLSLEATEPISISRHWDDQLHYDIVVSGKSFPIGSKIPVAFKFTPLAKVQVYKIRIFIAESIEYFTNDRQVHRREPGRKLLLMEKTAGKPMDPNFGADLRTTSGGELAHDRRGAGESSRQRSERGRDNLLGDLDTGVESFWGPTEIEANVQIPTCEMMRRNKESTLHADSSWKNVTVDHWVKIVMRVSRPDPDDPSGRKRRHFEISIDSPITLLDCRATQANTSLPEYSGLDRPRHHVQRVCGCPDAATLSSRDESTLSTIQRGFLPQDPPPGATAGRRQRPFSAVEPMGYERPIHLIRRPSFNPPAFDAEEPPPPPPEELDAASILTPPPRYDTIVGTPSVDGYADYFARYSARHGAANAEETIQESDDVAVEDEDEAVQGEDEDEEEEEETDSDGDTTLGRVGVVPNRKRLTERTGRVNVVNPRTPGGGRVPSRSLEISRPFVLSEPPVGRR